MKTKVVIFKVIYIFIAICQIGCSPSSSNSKLSIDSILSSDAESSSELLLSKDALSSSWWFLLTTNELPIVEGLPADEYYLVNNFPAIGSNFSNLNIKRDSNILKLGSEIVNIYQGGAALIEGKNISLLHAKGAETNTIGLHSRIIFDGTKVITGSWKFNGQSGPSLISDLKKPRHFRVSVDNIDPKPMPDQEFKFRLYVDGKPLSNLLINTTSVDVYGKNIIMQLETWPPVGLFKIDGSFIAR